MRYCYGVSSVLCDRDRVEWLTVALTAFALIVPVELPDKTFVATLVLSTRYRPLPVWLGVSAAFAVQCLVAVAAGHLLSRLPERPVQIVAAGLFTVGAVLLIRGARRADAEEAEQEQEYERRASAPRTGLRAAVTSFAVLFHRGVGRPVPAPYRRSGGRRPAGGPGVRRLARRAGDGLRRGRPARTVAAPARPLVTRAVHRRRGLRRPGVPDNPRRAALTGCR